MVGPALSVSTMDKGTRITMGMDSRLRGNDIGVELASIFKGSILATMAEEG